MKPKMTILGKADSIHIKRYVENIVFPMQYDTEILSDYDTKYSDFYRENNVKVISGKVNSIISKIPKVRWGAYLLRVLRYLFKARSDVFVVHYADPYLLRLLSIIKFNRPLVLTYWGSDLYRVSKKQQLGCKWIVDHATQIVVMTNEMKDALINVYGNDIATKTMVSDFGDSVIDKIDDLKIEQESIRAEMLKNAKDRLIITVGYNALTEQQHIRVIEALKQIENKEELFLLLPLSYKANKAYLKELVEVLDNSGFDYLAITDFMDDLEMARLYLTSDVFINAQKTDAISFSMIEHLYSGSLVCNGDWLKYDYLAENGIYTVAFHDFSQLVDIIKNYQSLNEKVSETIDTTKENIRRYCSWSACLERWREVLDKKVI